MRVEIENYQSIKETNFDVKGFTVLVGPTNIGKSATLNAIASAFFQRLGHDFVRTGESKSSVRVTVRGTDGVEHDIEWSKGKSINQFVVDGKVYDAVGRTAPEVIAGFGIRDPMTNSGAVRVLHTAQHDPPFLLFDPAEAISVIMASSRVAVVQKAASFADGEERSAKSEIGVRRKDLVEIEAEVAILSGFDELRDVPGVISEFEKGVQYLQDREKQLVDFIEVHSKLKNEKKALEITAEVLDCPYSKNEHLVSNMNRLFCILGTLNDDFSRLTDEKLVLEQAPETPTGVIPHFEAEVQCFEVSQRFFDLKQASLALEDFGSLLIDSNLVFTSAQLGVAALNALNAREELVKSGEKLREGKRELKKLLDEAGVCPICDRPIDGSMVEEVCHA